MLAALFCTLAVWSPTLVFPSESVPARDGSVELSGEFYRWHPITVTLDGPSATETAATFRNYRFEITLTHPATGTTRTVPGYFAADGEAARTSAASGTRWCAYFTPGHTGRWTYRVSFREGEDVAVAADPNAGTATDYDGITGSFTIEETRKEAPDVRALGFLQYDDARYYRYANGSQYLGIGMDSPESFLEYTGFDGTVNLSGPSYVRDWSVHVPDWNRGDPTWAGGTAGAMKGKGLIGAINYIASRGINQQYFITMSIQGDGRAAYPYVPGAAADGSYDVFDVSKLAQWQIVFHHMMTKGVTAHVLLQEVENELLFEGGSTSHTDNTLRKLYYRELIARLGWHPALIWNLGEEQNHTDNAPHGNAASTEQRRAWARYIRSVDSYDHPITIHNWQWNPTEYEEVFAGFLGRDIFEGPSLQWDDSIDVEIRRWHEASAEAERPWVVMMTEYNGGGQGANDTARAVWRKAALWESLMNGAGAVELYFGNAGGVDLSTEDLRPWADAFDQMRFARSFVEDLPLGAMNVSDAVAEEAEATYSLVQTGAVYLFYWEEASAVGRLDLRGHSGRFMVKWLNPRTGETTPETPIEGGSIVDLPQPSGGTGLDWALLVRQ